MFGAVRRYQDRAEQASCEMNDDVHTVRRVDRLANAIRVTTAGKF